MWQLYPYPHPIPLKWCISILACGVVCWTSSIMPNFNSIGSGVSEPQVAENRYLPLTGGIALTTVHALTCYTYHSIKASQTLKMTTVGRYIASKDVVNTASTSQYNPSKRRFSKQHSLTNAKLVITLLVAVVISHKTTNSFLSTAK